MAANLVRTYDAVTARQLLTLSFAQFQADRDVVRLERRLQRQRERLGRAARRGDQPVRRHRRVPARAWTSAAGRRVAATTRSSWRCCGSGPGAVIHASKGKHHGPVAVVATAHRKGGFRLTTITPSGHTLQLSGADFEVPPVQIGTVVLPGVYSPNRTDYRVEVGRRVQAGQARAARPRPGPPAAPARRPAPGCTRSRTTPTSKHRLRAAGQADRVRRDIAEIESRVLHRNAIVGAGVRRGAGDPRRARPASTSTGGSSPTGGEMLARSSTRATCSSPRPSGAACSTASTRRRWPGLVSSFVYEHRSPDDPPPPWFPNRDVRDRYAQIERLSAELAFAEQQHGLAVHRPPDPTFFAVAYAWVAGEGFAEVVAEEDAHRRRLRAGREAAHRPARPARPGGARPGHAGRPLGGAAEACFRGVVADSSMAAEAPVAGVDAPTARRRRDDPAGTGVGRHRRAPGGTRGRRRRRRTRGARARRAARLLRAVGRRPVPHRSGRPSRRDPVQRLPIDALAVTLDDRERARRRPRGRATRLVARQRCVAVMNCRPHRARGTSRRAPTRTTAASTSSRSPRRCRSATAGRHAAGCRTAPTCRTPTSACARPTEASWAFAAPRRRCGSTGSAAGATTRLAVRVLPDHFEIHV